MPKLPLKPSDFYKGGNPFDDIIKATDILQKELQKTAEQAKVVAKNLSVQSKQNPRQTAKDYKELANTTTELGRTVKAVNSANKEAEKLDIKKRQLLTEQAKLNARNTISIQNQKKALKEQAKESLGLVSAYDKLNKQLGTARKRAKDIAVQYGATSKQFRNASKEVLRLDSRIKKIDSSLGLSQRNVGNYGMAFKGAAGSLVSFAATYVGIRQVFRLISSSVKTIATFEKAMDEVVAITGATNEEFKELEKNALQLGATTSKTAVEVSGLQKEFAKLGFSTDEILDATEATISLSIAAGSDLAESAVVAASTVRGFGLSAAETQRVVDVMARSFSSSALDLEKFKVAMATAGPVANATGNDIEFTTAQLSVLADAGLDASTAGTSLRNIFLELSKRGLSFGEGLDLINKSSNKATAALDIFGKRGATAALVLADNTEKAKELEEAYNEAGGAAENMAKIMEDNLIGDTKLLSSAWDGFILSLNKGEGDISRVLRTATQGVTRLLTKIQELNSTPEELGFQRAEQSFKSTRDYILRQEKEFQKARLKEAIESEKVILASIQKELDKQGKEIFYAERTLKNLYLRRIQTTKTLTLLTNFQKELQTNIEEENELTAKQIGLIIRYNEETESQLELNKDSLKIAQEYYESLKAQQNTLEGLKEKLSELEQQKKTIDLNDSKRLIEKTKEIRQLKELIELYENLDEVLEFYGESFDKAQPNLKVDLEIEPKLADVSPSLDRGEEIIETIKARNAIIEDLENQHYSSLLDIFANYKNRKIAANRELSNEEVNEQIASNNEQVAAVQQLADTLISIYNGILENRLQQIDTEIQEVNQKIDDQQEAVNRELRLLESGAANQYNIEKEKLEKLQAEREKDLEEKRKIQKQQQTIDTASQISSLVTAIANIMEGFSEIPIVGVVLGLAAAAAAIAGFATYKSEAESSVQAEEGGTFTKDGTYIEKGKRHKDGGNKYSAAEFEQGEAVSVFSRDATRKYKDEIYEFENALNNDQWEMYRASLATINNRSVIINSDYSKLLREQQTTNALLRRGKFAVVKKNNIHFYTQDGKFIGTNL